MDKSLLLLFVMLLSTCSATSPEDNAEHLSIQVTTQDTTHHPQSEFEVGEDILFRARLVNQTSHVLECSHPDGRPPLVFLVWAEDSLVGKSFEGPFVHIPKRFRVLPDSQRIFTDRWLEAQPPLPPGEYLVTLSWQWQCNSMPLPQDSVQITVTE